MIPAPPPHLWSLFVCVFTPLSKLLRSLSSLTHSHHFIETTIYSFMNYLRVAMLSLRQLVSSLLVVFDISL